MRAAIDAEPLPELLEGCYRGDGGAQSRFFLRYQELVTRAVARTLSRYCRQPPVASDVDDLAQEVFEKLLKNDCRALLHVRGASCIDSWLVVVARHHTVDALRSEGARGRALVRLRGNYSDEELPVHAAMPDPGKTAESEETLQEARVLLEALPEQQRLSVQLFYEHGLSYAQIAEMLGQPPNTIASHLFRARKKLMEAWHTRQEVSLAAAMPVQRGDMRHG